MHKFQQEHKNFYNTTFSYNLATITVLYLQKKSCLIATLLSKYYAGNC